MGSGYPQRQVKQLSWLVSGNISLLILFLHVVNGEGQVQANDHTQAAGLYEVILATPEAEAPVFSAGQQPLRYLSFYWKPFLHPNR